MWIDGRVGRASASFILEGMVMGGRDERVGWRKEEDVKNSGGW